MSIKAKLFSKNYRDTRRISASLLRSIGFEEHDGFEDILDNFRYVSGRRFHNTTSKYSLPNDDIEVNRLELSHCLFKHAFNGNFSSPIQNKLKDGIAVLDVGCGSGDWVIENAKDYPKSTFIGIDISRIFPTTKKPQNAGFIECNVLDGLPFPANTFDFVHQRLLYAAFTEKQWLKVIKEIVRVLKPSGYAEFMELDILNFQNSGPYTKKVLKKVEQFYKFKGISLEDVPGKLKTYMDSTENFGEVKMENKVLPVGKWGGSFGHLMLEYVRMSIESYSIIMTKRFKYTKQEYLKLAKYFLEETEEHKTGLSYSRFYAQKI